MIPDYQTIMLPLLKQLSDGKIYRFREIVARMSEHFGLSDEERRQMLPSGNQALIDNRVGWARFYLKNAGLVKSEKRGYLEISEKGREYLAKEPQTLTTKDLDRIPEFKAFKEGIQKKKPTAVEKTILDSEDLRTPEESLEAAYEKLKVGLKNELLQQVKTSDPAFFEQLVVDLIVKMGYGGSKKDAGRAIGGSGDGGVDGIIKEDRLGLETIYIQAKRWENTVPLKEVRDFAGALLSKKAKKGIFLTTSDFPSSANDFVDAIEHRIILIDGDKLTDYMIEFGVGVSTQNIYEVKRMDTDYFQI